jgi:hypothetical protein
VLRKYAFYLLLSFQNLPNTKASSINQPRATHSSVVISSHVAIFCIILQSLCSPTQMKSLDGRTNFSECVFEALLKGVSTVFGRQSVKNCFETTFWKVRPTFQNLRLGGVNVLQKIVASERNQRIASFIHMKQILIIMIFIIIYM